MDSLFFHPKLVHLPIALAVLMPLIAGGVLLAWWREWLPGRSWVLVVMLQAVLVGSGGLALQSGESDEDRVEDIVAESYIEAHEDAAKAFVIASGAVLAVMLVAMAAIRTSAGLPAAGVALLGTLAVLALGYRTGEAGGDLVYRHGAASAWVVGSAAPGETGSPLRTLEDDDHDDD